MAASFITALILQHGNTVYMNDGVTPGQVGTIPSIGAGGIIYKDMWATPVDTGVVTGLLYTPTTPGSTDKPDIQSFHVVRIESRLSADDWYVLGTSTDYIAASNSAECCDSPLIEMDTDAPSLAPCQNICSSGENSPSEFIAMLGLPTLDEGEVYFPFGYFNGVPLTAASASGYATVDALLTFLNANWTTGNLDATWAASVDELTLTNTLSGGDDNIPDVLCAAVIAITP